MSALVAGVWRRTSPPTQFVVDQELAAFQQLVNVRYKQNLQLIKAETYEDNGRKWAGIWRPGPAGAFNTGLAEQDFLNLATSLHKKGMTLIDAVTYRDPLAGRLWAGVWTPGNARNYISMDLRPADFIQLADDRHKQGLTLMSIETYTEWDGRRWAGVWVGGTAANEVNIDLDLVSFRQLVKTRHANRVLIDMETYVDGNETYWAGLWVGGNEPNYFSSGEDAEEFAALVWERSLEPTALIDVNAIDTPCPDDCLNHVVMPVSYELTDHTVVDGSNPYIYKITSTATHCPGKPGTCGNGAGVVPYNWPVDLNLSTRLVRRSALHFSDQFLTLPFRDTSVKQVSGWLYSNDGWHHATDFASGDTFPVCAAADGTVIYIGWDWWSGNTVIVSHDVNGVTDAYRTIYMHLRNGPNNDANNAWNITVPVLQADPTRAAILAAYTLLLNGTGCPQNPPRNPDPAHWGDDSQIINPNLLLSKVKAGDALAYAGHTGPGGQQGLGKPNTHLHVFWARRDPSDNNWYLFDPWGIYSHPACYLSFQFNVPTRCARYGIAWKDGFPQFPA